MLLTETSIIVATTGIVILNGSERPENRLVACFQRRTGRQALGLSSGAYKRRNSREGSRGTSPEEEPYRL